MDLIESMGGLPKRPRQRQRDPEKTLFCQCWGDGCIENKKHNGTSYCETDSDGYCMAYMDTEDGEEGWIMGCLPAGEIGRLQCKGGQTRMKFAKGYKCCKGDFCNRNLITAVEENYNKDVEQREYEASQQMYQIGGLIVVGCTVFVLAFFLCRWIYRKMKTKKHIDHETAKHDFDSSLDVQSTQCDGVTPLLPHFQNLSLKQPLLMPFGQYGQYASSNGSNNSFHTPLNYHYAHLSNFSSNMTSSQSSNATLHTTIHSSGNIGSVTEDSANSGMGGNYLRQKTIWQECDLEENPLGVGRFNYTSVWKARYNKMDVVVKIYHSQMQHRYRREIECYVTTNMRNRNLLAFFGQDIKDNRGSLEHWIISQYHPMGSLHDYLRMNPIRDIPQLLSIFYSIIDGLNHLHSIVHGSGQPSPGIAHRDLKSRSILMQSSHECCIADFGMAVISDDIGVGIRDSINLELTNPRYMAPEVLNGEIFNSFKFNDYKQADIYSLGLIFWEVLNCLQVDRQANAHQLPYEDLVPEVEGSAPEDMMEPMRQVVCGQTYRRPPFTATNIQIVSQVQGLIRECFAQKPSSRLGSLVIKKKVMEFQLPKAVQQ